MKSTSKLSCKLTDIFELKIWHILVKMYHEVIGQNIYNKMKLKGKQKAYSIACQPKMQRID